MEEQEIVAAFVRDHDMEAPPAYRLLDVVSELGEVAKDAVTATEYGHRPGAVHIGEDELGDVLFAFLALAEAVNVDAGDALEAALAKYGARIADSGSASSTE